MVVFTVLQGLHILHGCLSEPMLLVWTPWKRFGYWNAIYQEVHSKKVLAKCWWSHSGPKLLTNYMGIKSLICLSTSSPICATPWIFLVFHGRRKGAKVTMVFCLSMCEWPPPSPGISLALQSKPTITLAIVLYGNTRDIYCFAKSKRCLQMPWSWR